MSCTQLWNKENTPLDVNYVNKITGGPFDSSSLCSCGCTCFSSSLSFSEQYHVTSNGTIALYGNTRPEGQIFVSVNGLETAYTYFYNDVNSSTGAYYYISVAVVTGDILSMRFEGQYGAGTTSLSLATENCCKMVMYWQSIYNCSSGWGSPILSGVNAYQKDVTPIYTANWQVGYGAPGADAYCHTTPPEIPQIPDTFIYSYPYSWSAFFDCSSNSWQVMGPNELGDYCYTSITPITDWIVSGESAIFYSENQTQPSNPSQNPTCYYHWEAMYDCETFTWSLMGGMPNLNLELTGWVISGTSAYCITASSSEPSLPTESGNC